ncbi:MAG: hypothetical protein J4F43_08705 [Dehalococcoidia bacterium]|nr:hypothetical protein [Dehalococcoidia bacterium]
MKIKPFLVMLSCFALCLAACGGQDDGPDVAPAGPLEASIPEIYTEFQADRIKANDKWRDVVVIVEGAVRRTGESEGIPLVSVQHVEGTAADCYFSPDKVEGLADLKTGQVLTLVEKVRGANRESLELDECVIMSVRDT